MGSQNWWLGDPRPLLYTSKPLYSRFLSQKILTEDVWFVHLDEIHGVASCEKKIDLRTFKIWHSGRPTLITHVFLFYICFFLFTCFSLRQFWGKSRLPRMNQMETTLFWLVPRGQNNHFRSNLLQLRLQPNIQYHVSAASFFVSPYFPVHVIKGYVYSLMFFILVEEVQAFQCTN